MMKMSLIYFGLLLNCLIYSTYAQTFICNSIEGYNMKALTSALQWKVTTDYQCLDNRAANCTFFISFCQTASMCFNEYSACQNSSESSNRTVIGAFTHNPFYENESGEKGFYAKFPPAPVQNISNTTYCAPSLKIKFVCDPDAIWLVPVSSNVTANAPEPKDIDFDPNDPCATIMTFDYNGACLKNGKDSKKEISAGAIFLIILFSSALVYFIIGAGYNGLVKHRSGINLLPQAQFWIGLPLYAIEGCRAILTCCSGSTKPSPATYEAV